jgi:TRAP-type C4-dicarboxylate transport system substrate-binding protein
MSTLEVKGGMYEMISKVNDKKLLMQLYELISDIIAQNLSDTDFWDELSESQKEELEKAIQESHDDKNLLS